MRLAIMVFVILILSGCATTTPQKETASSSSLSNRWLEYAKSHAKQEEKNAEEEERKRNDIKGFGSIFSNALGSIMGAMSLAERKHFTNSLGRSMLGKPARIYKEVSTLSIYDNARIIMDGNGFDLSLIDKESGFILGVLNRGVVREFLFWDWEQKQYITFLFLPTVGRSNRTRFYHLSWVEERPPLSSKFVEVELNDEAEKLIKEMITELDKTVQKLGGEI